MTRTCTAGTVAAAFPPVARILSLWLLTRALLLLCVFKVLVLPGPDVTGDVSVIYQGWSDVLRTGSFPLDDVTWQYPPAAALAILSPGLLPFLEYTSAFFVLVLLCDAAVTGLLLYTGRRPGRSLRGTWVWVAGVPLLGPTAYARYDLMVTGVAVAALLAGVRRPRVMGALAAFGALLKVWPVLLLAGVGGPLRGAPAGAGERSRARRGAGQALGAAVVTASVLVGAFAVTMPGALAFLTFQRDRGTEVESVGALVLHVARAFGWEGTVQLSYGSLEFLGPHVTLVSGAAQVLSVLAFCWLVLWRLRARAWSSGTVVDAAFAAVLLFTTTSRVISPQYLLWLVGLAAVCLVFPRSRMGRPAALVLAATFVTLLEFPIWFSHVVDSDALGIALMLLRNGLLVAATFTACRTLWRQTVTEPGQEPDPGPPVRPAHGDTLQPS